MISKTQLSTGKDLGPSIHLHKIFT